MFGGYILTSQELRKSNTQYVIFNYPKYVFLDFELYPKSLRFSL